MSAAAYPRTTSIDFLQRCSARIAAFYHHWDIRRRGREMPARSDFDPLEMKEWLPGIILVDVFHNPRRMIYRLVGSRSVELRQSDVTGKSVEDGFHGPTLAAVMENYRLVVDEKKLVYDWDGTISRTGLMKYSETLMLPLSSDGSLVDMVLIYLEMEAVDQ